MILYKIRHGWIRFIIFIISIAEFLFYYPLLSKKLKKYLDVKRDILIFDIGANRGQSILFFKKFAPYSKIYSFEPSKKIFKLLERNTSNMQGVYIFNEALGSKSSILDFYESKLDETSTFKLPNMNSTYHRVKSKILMVNPSRMYTVEKIKTSKLDSKVKELNIPQIDLCKIDVEGFELNVLKGAINLIKNGKIKVFLIERHDDGMRESEYQEITQLLNTSNYITTDSIKHPFGKFYDDVWVLRK